MKKKLVWMILVGLSFGIVYAGDLVDDSYGNEWYTDLNVAKEIAAEQNKPIFLFAGRDTCSLCNATKKAIASTDPNNFGLMTDEYVPVYMNVDTSTDWYKYFIGIDGYTLPYTAVLPVNDYDTYLFRNSGKIGADKMFTILDEYKDAEVDLNTLQYVELNWYTDFEEGFKAAESAGLPVFLFAGRETCGNCNYVKTYAMQSVDDPNVKGLLVSNYILIYQDVDTQYDFWKYYTGSGSITLPFIAVISSYRGWNADEVHTGFMTAEELYELIRLDD